MHEIAAFLVLAFMLSVVPGPDSFLVLRHSLRSGRRTGIATAAGAAAGSLFWGLTSVAGIAVLLQQSALIYELVRLAGALYLIALGASIVLSHVSEPRAGLAAALDDAEPSSMTDRKAGLQGLLSDLLNPKVGLFYLAVLPQFIPPGASVLQFSLLLCVIEVLIALTWLVAIAFFTTKVTTLLKRPRVRNGVELSSGGAIMASGLAVALET